MHYNNHNKVFTVIVAFYNICLFKNFAITILKVVGCENCLQDNNLLLWGLGGETPAAGQFLLFFRKK